MIEWTDFISEMSFAQCDNFSCKTACRGVVQKCYFLVRAEMDLYYIPLLRTRRSSKVHELATQLEVDSFNIKVAF